MAPKTEKTKAEKTEEAKAAAAAMMKQMEESFARNAEAALPEGFATMGLDRLFYKPAKCLGAVIQGIPWEVVRLEGENDFFEAYAIKLTKPCKACLQDKDNPDADSDGDIVVDVQAGDEILISVTEKLKLLKPYVIHPELCVEFIIMPLGAIRIGGTDDKPKTMHRYKVGGGKPMKRVDVAGASFAALAAGQPAGARAELPAG